MFLTSCSTSIENSVGENIGCSLGDVVQDRPLIIASTVAPITSIIANIAGGTTTQITGVVPEGTNSHTFEPKPSDAAILESADVIFINGLVLEEPTKNLALANLQESANICELGSEILPESEYIYDFSFPKEGGKPNPHLWTNPPMAKQYARIVRDVLVRRDPINATVYEQNFMAFAAKVDLLDRAMKVATETIPVDQRKLLTYHDAYAYFATNYGFEVVGAIQPSSFDEPTPKEIGELILQVKSQRIMAIFGSEVFPSTVLEQIGAETGVRYVDVLRDDDLIGEPGDAEHSWLGLMRFNFVAIVEALGGDASALKSLDVRDVVKDEAKYSQ
ncbi:MAG: zinc ABC transporter substrate-binding protein [Acidimicrobium sp.]|nr:MAG: zinc ABC transporter substrate-binding protein [Acidimicrobium sp.]